MKKITIGFWHSPIPGIKYQHMDTMEYTGLYDTKINEIISQVINKGASIMIRPTDNGIIIWVDNGRFGQK